MPDIVLADMVAFIHLGYVLFVLVGFVLIVMGIILRWGWIRNLWFRVIHVAAMVLVALEALLGIECPLTVLEFELRHDAPRSDRQVSFVGDIVDALLFYGAPVWLFTFVYSVFAVLVVVIFILAPPARRGRSGVRGRKSGFPQQ